MCAKFSTTKKNSGRLRKFGDWGKENEEEKKRKISNRKGRKRRENL